MNSDNDTRACALLAKSPDVDLADQKRLAHDPRLSVRKALASNPAITPDVQRILAGSPEGGAHRVLARNPSLIEELFRTFAEDFLVFQQLVMNPSIPADLLERAVASADPSRKSNTAAVMAAHNPGLTHAQQRRLIDGVNNGDRPFVLLNLGTNPSMDPSLAAEVLDGVWSHSMAELFKRRPDFPVSAKVSVKALSGHPVLRAFVEDHTRGLDPLALSALLPSWSGTLEDLVTAVEELGPDNR